MKTRFEINSEIFLDNGSLEKCFDFYDKYYKELGFILDKENQDVYYETEREFNLNEGDRIDLFTFKIVKWKCVDVINEIIIYSMEEE